MYGRKYMGIFRTTFIINEEGVIERIISPKEVENKRTRTTNFINQQIYGQKKITKKFHSQQLQVPEIVKN